MLKKPAEKYLHRKLEVESIQVRCDTKVKKQAEAYAKKLDTSVARLTEAALIYYMESLNKESKV